MTTARHFIAEDKACAPDRSPGGTNDRPSVALQPSLRDWFDDGGRLVPGMNPRATFKDPYGVRDDNGGWHGSTVGGPVAVARLHGSAIADPCHPSPVAAALRVGRE